MVVLVRGLVWDLDHPAESLRGMHLGSLEFPSSDLTAHCFFGNPKKARSFCNRDLHQ
jgi:hypothetical protein